MVPTLRPILIMKTYQWFQMQLYCNLCNYISTIFSNIGEWSNATILHIMQLYATISHLMQLYATYATICNYIATYATILQLYATFSTICNYIETYATILQLYATILHQFCMQLYCNNFVCNYIATMQLYATFLMQHVYPMKNHSKIPCKLQSQILLKCCLHDPTSKHILVVVVSLVFEER
jgi:hypothetical protein